jgi:hypothetical protein
LDQEVRNQYFQSSVADFKTFLEKHKGSSLRKNTESAQKIQIEKYAPVKSEEELKNF